MDWLPKDPHYVLLLLGLTIVILVMLRLTLHRLRNNHEKQRKREESIQAAKRAEQKRQQEILYPKSKVYSPKTRAPLADPFSASFTGNIQGIAAKWEAEVHQIGRQIIGQIDSKMSALQTIILDANRTANRLDILVEHLEHLARQQITVQQNLSEQSETATQDSSVIPAAESVPDGAPLAVVLKELTEDLEGIQKAINKSTKFEEQPLQATILRLSEIQDKNLRSEVEMLANYGMNTEEIARRLDISVSEVDIILQIQQNG